MTIKEFIGNSVAGKNVRFKCNCTARIDVTGTIVGYSVIGSELMLKIQTQEGKLYDIGENHPNMEVTVL